MVFLSHWHLWCSFAAVGPAQNFVQAFLQNCHETLIFTTWPTGGHHPAVLAFFILSGFCIHYPAEWRRMHGNRTLPAGDYYRRRFLRIMPVYWVASLLGLLLVGLELGWPSGNPLLQFHAQAPLAHIVVRFLGIAGFYPEEIFVGNYILNTIAAEIVMYAAYPVFHRLAMDRRWGTLGLAFLLMHAFAIVLLRLGFSPYWAFNSLFMLGLFWFAGALAAHGFVALRWRLSGRWVLLAWAVFLLVKGVPHFYGLNLIKQAVWGLVCVAGLLWVLTFEEKHGTWRRQGIVRALCYGGAISYSLYAVHTPVMLITTWFLVRVAGCESYFVQLPLNLLTAVGATLACYYLVERRFYRPQITAAPRAGA